MVITDDKLGVKIAENPRDKLIQETIEGTKERIVQLELELELKREGLKFLETLK